MTSNVRQKSAESLQWAIWLGLGSLFCALISYNFADIDIWHEMALIRESLAAGHLLKADPYAYTPTIHPLVDHEWGAGLIAYFLTARLGSSSLIVLKFLLALGTAFLCVQCSKMRGTDFRLLGICAPLPIGLMYLGFFSVLRAQAYSFFFTALLLMLWEFDDRFDDRRACTWVLAWLAVFPVWLNVHGGFVIAIALTGLHIVEQLLRRNPVRRPLLLLGGMCAEVLFNPYGVAYVSYLKRALSMARPYAAEWGPVWTLGEPLTAGFMAAVLVGAYAVASAGLRQTSGILVLSATMLEAALHRKLLPFFAIAWLCYVPSYLQQSRAGIWLLHFAQKRSRFMQAAWIALACICLTASTRQEPWKLNVPQPIYPVGAVQYLARQHFAGNLMTPFRLGAYISWKLFPAVKVSLDSRYEVAYPDDVVQRVFTFYDARPGWRAMLDGSATDAVLVPRGAPVEKLMSGTNWTRTYADQEFEIYVRPGIRLPFEDWSAASFRGVFP
ncbi:MAG TPA: hypothetical protein VGM18_20005 [Candidatus Sulfotelmatobacter sp.]|jgi:hypothetical protein